MLNGRTIDDARVDRRYGSLTRLGGGESGARYGDLLC